MRTILCFLLLVAIIAMPLVAQDEPDGKRFYAVGLTADTSQEQSLSGWAAIGIPITERIVSYTDTDVAVVKGATVRQLMNNEGLQYSLRTGFAYRLLDLSSWLSVWGLGDAGISAGGPEGMDDQIPVSGSFAGGGFVRASFKNKINALIILQVDKNAATGRRFIPRIGLQFKF